MTFVFGKFGAWKNPAQAVLSNSRGMLLAQNRRNCVHIVGNMLPPGRHLLPNSTFGVPWGPPKFPDTKGTYPYGHLSGPAIIEIH